MAFNDVKKNGLLAALGLGPSTTFDQVLLYGQSLSLGSVPTGASVVSPNPSPTHLMFNGGVRVHYDTPGIVNVNTYIDPDQAVVVVPLQEQINVNDAGFGETYAYGMGVNLSNPTLFSSTGRGAYRIWELNRTSEDHFQNTYSAAQWGSQAAEVAGETYNLKGIIWKQGEADAGDGMTGATWAGYVEQLRDDFAVHLSNATLQDASNFIMVVDQQAFQGLKGTTTGGELGVAAIDMHRDAGNNIICAGPTYAEEFVAVNDPHMTSVGYRVYGEKLGQVVEDIETWEPCYITGATRVGTVVTATVNVPHAPLVVDTTLVSSVADLGFAYTTAGITSVVVTDTGGSGTGQIEITLDAAVAGTLEYAFKNNEIDGRIGPTAGPRGNIRDSDPLVAEYNGRNLYNWLCVDNWSVA